jgi:hypothetical protein
MLLVEHKSRGKNLDRAFSRRWTTFPACPSAILPQLIIVCDFARFRVHRLATGTTTEFALKDLHKHIKPVRLCRRLQGAGDQGARPRQHQGGRAHGPAARCAQGQRLRRPPAGSAAGAPAVLPVRRRHRHLSAAQAFRAFYRGAHRRGRLDLGARLAQLFQVLNTRRRNAAQSGRAAGHLSLHQRQAV